MKVLKGEIDEINFKIDIENIIDELSDVAYEIDKVMNNIYECNSVGIIDIDDFIFCLKRDNLYSKEIDDYIKYYIDYIQR